MADRLSAPGKLFLAGEYAVLAGRPAVVAAVAPWARAEARTPLASWRGLYPGALATRGPIVDTRAFFIGSRKLGFGSSAAAGVLATAAEMVNWPDAETLWRGIRATQGELVGRRGSGGDIAAILAGGVVAVHPREGEAPATTRLAFPPGASLIVVDLGRPADTPSLSDTFRRHLEGGGLDDWLEASSEACARIFAGDWFGGFAAAAKVYADLDRRLGGGLIPGAAVRATRILASSGLACKPSGAGAGDVAVAYVPDVATASRGLRALREAGLFADLRRPTSLGLHRLRAAPTADDRTLSTLRVSGSLHR